MMPEYVLLSQLKTRVAESRSPEVRSHRRPKEAALLSAFPRRAPSLLLRENYTAYREQWRIVRKYGAPSITPSIRSPCEDWFI